VAGYPSTRILCAGPGFQEEAERRVCSVLRECHFERSEIPFSFVDEEKALRKEISPLRWRYGRNDDVRKTEQTQEAL
jgi:hypothetical protein